MFTGLIEEMGIIADIADTEKGFTLTITAKKILKDIAIGDSICVNGVCLTVTTFTSDHFTVDAVPETLKRTNLGDCDVGSKVNLERSATPATRLGGHYVQGHVDGTGQVMSFTEESEALWVKIKAPIDMMKYIVTKGYITVDGTSLTVVDVGSNWFTLTLIPHTQDHIVLPSRVVGDRVNLEVDIIAKYVEKIVAAGNTAQTKGAT